MNPPQIIIYASTGDAPDHMKWASAMVPRTVPEKGRMPAHTEPGTSYFTTGRSAEEARGKLVAMWEKQHPPPRKPPVKAAPADDIGDVI